MWEEIKYTSTLFYLEFVEQVDDTVVLYNSNSKQYIILNSKEILTGPSKKDAYNSASGSDDSGSWLFVYCEAKSDFIL